jgi:hypothetical protein
MIGLGFGLNTEVTVRRFGLAGVRLGRIAAVEQRNFRLTGFCQPHSQLRRVGRNRLSI